MNIERTKNEAAIARGTALPPREDVKKLFKGSLIRLMEERGYTSGHLSTLTGIGRSVVKTYTDESLALPNAYQLIRLANVLECDVSELLPSQMLKTDRCTKKLIIELSDALSLNEKAREISNTLHNLEGKYIYYAPKSFPEGLKIEAIIKKEFGDNLKPGEIEYFQSLEELLDINANGCFLLRQSQIDDLIFLRGTYSTLSTTEMMAQIQALRRYEEHKFPNLQIKVMPTNAYLMTDILLIENTVAYHEIFNMVITITDPEFLASATSIMNEKIKTSTNLGEYIDRKLDDNPMIR